MENYGKLFSLCAVAMVLACDTSSPGSVGTPGASGGSGAGNTFGTGGVGSVGNTGQGGTVSGSVPGVTAPNPGGTWVVPPDATGGGPGHGGPKGAGGAGGPSGSAGSTGVACPPGVVGPVVADCGYPYTSSNPLTSVVFNESEVLRAIRPSLDATGGVVSLLYNDEHGMTLGVRQVVVKSASGTTTTDYPVSPLKASPDSILSPLTGTNILTGDQSGLDPSLRPLWPVLYVTDTTNNPSNRAGDWQMGGRPINPNAVYGTWKSAVRTVDNTVSPAAVSVTPDVDPAKNDWNFILNDPVPSGIKNEGWSAQVRWGVIFQPGHTYRLQVIVHDGDQNKVGGDCGEACIVFCTGSTTGCVAGRTCGEGASCLPGESCVNGCCTTPPGCGPEGKACGEGMSPTGGFQACPQGQSCLNGCCTELTCPVGSAVCGQIGEAGQIVACQSGETCVSGCCLSSQPIP
jgi:hypothetical protein